MIGGRVTVDVDAGIDEGDAVLDGNGMASYCWLLCVGTIGRDGGGEDAVPDAQAAPSTITAPRIDSLAIDLSIVAPPWT